MGPDLAKTLPDQSMGSLERLLSTLSTYPIDLLATDLDGTLLTDGLVSEETQLGWWRWCEVGGKLVIVTGRPLQSLVHLLAGQGCGHSCPWPHALVCEERDIYLHEQGEWRLQRNSEACSQVEKQVLPRAARVAVELIAAAHVDLTQVSRSEQVTEQSRGYIELQYPDIESAETGRQLAVSLVQGCDLVAVRNGRLLALRHPLSQKGPALLRLAQALAIKPEHVLAVGDSHNDLTMLDGSFGFLSATVANADPIIANAVKRANGIYIAAKAGRGVALLLNTLAQTRHPRAGTSISSC